MADTIERTIYKLEIDDSNYIKGVESLAASTNKLSQAQEQANKTLKANEEALKKNAAIIEKQRKELESFTGADDKFRKQLEANLKRSIEAEKLLTDVVNKNRIAYESARKAAEGFVSTSQKATQLQQGTTGGKIPTSPLLGQIRGAVAQSALSLEDLPAIVRETIPEFETLRKVIADVEAHMATLNAESEEFKLFAPIVAQGKTVLQQYDKAAEGAGGKVLTLRTQIRQGREELVKMEQAGKGNTKEFFELEKRVARLTDAFGDQQQRIKVLASDTRALDFGKAAITSATSAFQVYASVSILAGDESAELQKKTMQLFAAMQLLTALEQLSNTVKRGGVLATNAQAASQAVYTAVVGASTGALKAFRLALLGTGIGAVVVGIGLLVNKFSQLANAAELAGEKQKLLKEINEEAIKGYTSEVTKLELIRNKLSDLDVSQKSRIALAKDYNKTAEEGNKIDLKQIDNIALVNKAIDSQIEKIKQRGLARAAENIITQRAEVLQLAEEEARDKNLAFSIQATTPIEGTQGDPVFQKTAQINLLAKRVREDQDVIKAQDALNKALQIGGTFITAETLTTPSTATVVSKIENVFLQRLKELQARLAGVTAKSFESEGTIRKQFAASLEKELFSIDELLKKKQLTAPQSTILKGIIEKISKTELDQALGVFRDKQAAALSKIQSSIDDAIAEDGKRVIENIRDEFERERETIEQESTQALSLLSKKQADLFKQIDDDTKKGLISPQVAKRKKLILTLVFGDLADQVEAQKATRQVELAYKQFQSFIDKITDGASEEDTKIGERLAELVRDEKDKLDAGVITFKQFQDNVTKLTKEAADARNVIRLNELQKQLDAVNVLLESTDDPEIKQRLEKQQRGLRSAISALTTSMVTGVTGKVSEQAEEIIKHAEAIGAVVDSIISFWQKATEAESKSLDKSIALQEKRVEAAQRIAARGNAQYLKQEEDRLRELTIKRENAARRDLAINAALQASQILVAITGAVAKLANPVPGAGLVETLSSIGVIVGALATGYALVKSLQNNQPRLAEGTTYVSRGKNKRGKDTIPAFLDEGEAVTSAEKNRAYHPVIKAIHNGSIPSEHLNKFVSTYHKIKSVQRPDYNRIKDAAESHISYDSRTASLITDQNKLIIENNDLQRQTLRAMKNMSVSANIDRDGVSIMVNEYISQMKIDKKI